MGRKALGTQRLTNDTAASKVVGEVFNFAPSLTPALALQVKQPLVVMGGEYHQGYSQSTLRKGVHGKMEYAPGR